MADQQAPEPAGRPIPPEHTPAGTPDPGQMGPKKGADPIQLHTHALQAEKHLEALATGLGQADADPGVIKAVSQMADAMRKIASAMAKAPTPPPKAGRPASMQDATNELAANARQQPAQ
jgi:hypothetical protein